MNPDVERFLNLRNLPDRLTVTEVAAKLNLSPHEIPILVAKALLKPLGHPPQNGQKYFAACELERLRIDADWLAKASDSLVRHWRRRNLKKLCATNN